MCLVFLLLVSAACSPQVTDEDARRRERIATEFGAHYEFKLTRDVYVDAHRRTGQPTHEEGTAIYRAFWLDDNGQKRSDTNYVYLNLYDAEGEFAFQASWDAQASDVKYSNTEHY